MPTSTTQFMDLVLPVPTEEPGPQYAFEINQAMVQIDQHTHSAGQGQPITPAGMNINIDLEFNDNNATELRSTRYEAQPSPISGGTDLGCTYVSGVDLYYNDINGNQVRMTASGAVAGTPGSIGNLLPPANVTYVPGSQTYVFQSSTATAGNIDGGSYTFREVLANAKGITVSSPAALAADYTLTFPPGLPVSGTKFLTVDSSGNIGDSFYVDTTTLQVSSSGLGIIPQAITQSLLAPRAPGQIVPPGGFGISLSSGNFSTNSGTPVSVTNLSVTLVTLGRPIKVELIPGSTGSVSFISVTQDTATAEIDFLRNGDVFAKTALEIITGSTNLICPYSVYDFPASSSYTYSVQAFTGAGATMNVRNMKLIAYEI